MEEFGTRPKPLFNRLNRTALMEGLHFDERKKHYNGPMKFLSRRSLPREMKKQLRTALIH